MKNKRKKRVTSMVVAVLILSNSVFLYADEKTLLDHHSIADLTINENDDCKPRIKINLINDRQFVLYNERNKLTIEDTDESDNKEDDSDYTLSLLNMGYSDYKTQLKNGESLQTLLKKNDVIEKYNENKYVEYENILKNAVKNNAITDEDMTKLLADFTPSFV